MSELEFNPYPLRSEKGIDYQPLKALLLQGNWEAADHQTTRFIKQLIAEKSVLVASHPGFYDPDDAYDIYRLERSPIPCADLLTIDHLWVSASFGRFGVSVQARIYLECLETYASPEYPQRGIKPFDLLMQRVGWKHYADRGESNYRPGPFTTTDPPDGYLPTALLNLYSNTLHYEYTDSFTEFVFERLFQCCVTHYLHYPDCPDN